MNAARQAAERIVPQWIRGESPEWADVNRITNIIQEAIDSLTAKYYRSLQDVTDEKQAKQRQSNAESCQLISDMLRERLMLERERDWLDRAHNSALAWWGDAINKWMRAERERDAFEKAADHLSELCQVTRRERDEAREAARTILADLDWDVAVAEAQERFPWLKESTT